MLNTTQPMRSTRREKTGMRVEDGLVFRRTISGHNECEHHGAGLSPALSRLLRLVGDGQSIDDLVYFVRANELPSLMAELLSMGLVEAVAPEESTPPAIEASTPLSPMRFEHLRRTVLHGATELLGEEIHAYLDRIYACGDSGELRIVIDDLIAHIARMHGESDARLFIQTVRAAVRPAQGSA